VTRLRQSKTKGQLRLLPAASMPRAPLEAALVDAIKVVAHRMGFDVFSGRMRIFGHRPPYLPVLGPGTPDLLLVHRDGRLLGIEAKRDASQELRQSQKLWQAMHPAILVLETRSVEEAAEWLRGKR
jgi:hypothetical protein